MELKSLSHARNLSLIVMNRPSELSVRVASLICAGLIAGNSCPAQASEASIKDPGPDLANFPNSAFTLPKGRAYAELAPVNYNSRSRGGDPSQYSAGYLLRYGLTDDIELRWLSDGYTWRRGAGGTSGIGPQVADVKFHICDENKEAWTPAFGIEVALQTNWAKSSLRGGVQPSLSLNFDQTLPQDIAFEYNVGFNAQDNDAGKRQYQLALSWAFQREVVDDVAVFVNGFTNAGQGASSSAVGGGLQWIPAKRLAVFTNISAGLTDITPRLSVLAGFAVAF